MKKVYTCFYCIRDFATLSGLERHIDREHEH